MTKWDDTARLIQAHYTNNDEQFRTLANIHCAQAPDNRKIKAGQLRAIFGAQRVAQLPGQLTTLLLSTPSVQLGSLLLQPGAPVLGNRGR